MTELDKTIDAVAFATSDLVQPITIVCAAGHYLLTELSETDPKRWDVTQALGSLVAARKSIEAATDTLLSMMVTEAPADDVFWEKPCPAELPGSALEIARHCELTSGHAGEHEDSDPLLGTAVWS